jgi:hypothetical protein
VTKLSVAAISFAFIGAPGRSAGPVFRNDPRNVTKDPGRNRVSEAPPRLTSPEVGGDEAHVRRGHLPPPAHLEALRQ